MTTPVLTEDGKRLAEALVKAKAMDPQYLDAGDLAALNAAAASLRLPLEGDASLREALKPFSAEAYRWDNPDHGLPWDDDHLVMDNVTVGDFRRVRAALARPQPAAQEPAAAGVEWLLIESHPRDEKPVRLKLKNGQIVAGYWGRAVKATGGSRAYPWIILDETIGTNGLAESEVVGWLPLTPTPAAPKTPDAATGGSVGDRVREALKEITGAADDLLNTLPGHWHDDATIRLTDAANDARTTLKAAEQEDLYEPTAPAGEDDTGVREALDCAVNALIMIATRKTRGPSSYASAELEKITAMRGWLGSPQPPKAETPAGVEDIARAIMRGQGHGDRFIEVMRASDANSWHSAMRSAERVAALSTAPAARPGDEVERVRKTDAEIVAEVNSLAAFMLSIQGTGYAAPEGFKFYKAAETNVRAVRAWKHAVEAYEMITATEVHDALLAVEEDVAFAPAPAADGGQA